MTILYLKNHENYEWHEYCEVCERTVTEDFFNPSVELCDDCAYDAALEVGETFTADDIPF